MTNHFRSSGCLRHTSPQPNSKAGQMFGFPACNSNTDCWNILAHQQLLGLKRNQSQLESCRIHFTSPEPHTSQVPNQRQVSIFLSPSWRHHCLHMMVWFHHFRHCLLCLQMETFSYLAFKCVHTAEQNETLCGYLSHSVLLPGSFQVLLNSSTKRQLCYICASSVSMPKHHFLSLGEIYVKF